MDKILDAISDSAEDNQEIESISEALELIQDWFDDALLSTQDRENPVDLGKELVRLAGICVRSILDLEL